MNARMEWLSAIYQDMTGTVPPKEFWNTPTGQGIVENASAYLYDQPTCNLDEIVGQLSEKNRQEVYRLVRRHNEDSCSELCNSGFLSKGDENEDEPLFQAVLVRSSLRTPPPENRRDAPRYRSSEPEMKEFYKKQLMRYESRRNQSYRFLINQKRRTSSESQSRLSLSEHE